uniref:Uncharacterized protein MANES_03G172800 n=1 Tax=Rhizophora mucronata TaxID=61149 RepID=A0A2P2K023_RHIMU
MNNIAVKNKCLAINLNISIEIVHKALSETNHIVRLFHLVKRSNDSGEMENSMSNDRKAKQLNLTFTFTKSSKQNIKKFPIFGVLD